MNNWDLYKYSHKDSGETTVIKDTRFKELVERTLTSVEDSDITTIGNSAISACDSLISVNFPSVTKVASYSLSNNKALTDIKLPLAETFDNYVFAGCSKINVLSLPSAKKFGGYVFKSCTELLTLILGGNVVCNLTNINAFEGTLIASGAGYIYVPSALVETYKTATNWTVYADQIRAIEDYPEITGG